VLWKDGWRLRRPVVTGSGQLRAAECCLVLLGPLALELDHRRASGRLGLIFRHRPDMLAVVTRVVVHGGEPTQALQVGA
jgi:hypothetical protein